MNNEPVVEGIGRTSILSKIAKDKMPKFLNRSYYLQMKAAFKRNPENVRISLEFEKTKYNYIKSNYIQSGYEKSWENVYRRAKK